MDLGESFPSVYGCLAIRVQPGSQMALVGPLFIHLSIIRSCCVRDPASMQSTATLDLRPSDRRIGIDDSSQVVYGCL